MPALQLSSVAFMQPFDADALSSIVKNRESRFHLNLSNYDLIGVLNAYQAHKRKQSPTYTNSAMVFQLNALQATIGGSKIMPIDVIDEFWVVFEQFLMAQGIRPSTIEHYFDSIRAALGWASKHQCPISESYDEYEVGNYSRTKVALTADEVSLIAHFDIASAFSCKDEDFIDRAKAMLSDDVAREENKRVANKEKLIRHAQKNYNTAIAAADKLYHERLSRPNVSDYKKRKAKSLYQAEKMRAKEILTLKVKEAEKANMPLTDIEKDGLLCKRIECLKNQSEFMRHKKIETYERVRDQFILQCSLGQRYSDISRITPSCFSDDLNTFTIVQQKTGNKAVVDIPKFAFDKKVVRQILNKYGCYAPYPHGISNFNNKLKELVKVIGFNDVVKSENKIHGKMVIEETPKNMIITSHTARRTFATYNYNVRGYSEISVRRATGHTDGRSFERYIIFDED